MKKILGLDLGSTSVGWAFIHESDETTKIIGAGECECGSKNTILKAILLHVFA